MRARVLLGAWIPASFEWLASLEYARVNLIAFPFAHCAGKVSEKTTMPFLTARTANRPSAQDPEAATQRSDTTQ